MNFKSTFFVIPIPLYYVDVLVSFGQTQEELYTSIKGKYPDYDKDPDFLPCNKHGIAWKFNNGNCVMRVQELPTTAYWKGVLAHEIFHVTTFIAQHIGLRLSDKSDEAYAYLNEYITEQVYTILEERC